jgi:hypothetical protein
MLWYKNLKILQKDWLTYNMNTHLKKNKPQISHTIAKILIRGRTEELPSVVILWHKTDQRKFDFSSKLLLPGSLIFNPSSSSSFILFSINIHTGWQTRMWKWSCTHMPAKCPSLKVLLQDQACVVSRILTQEKTTNLCAWIVKYA